MHTGNCPMNNASDDLVERVTDELLAHGEFSSSGHNRSNARFAAEAVIEIAIKDIRAKLAAEKDEATRQFYRTVVAETKLATATKALELVIMSDCGEPKVCAEIATEALRSIKEKP